MTGQTLSHYRVLEKIGEGATGVVYKAEDLTLGRAVALKFLPPELWATGAVYKFQLEARTASGLNHPNICTIYEIAEHDHRQFIVMEFLEGEVLSRVIRGQALESGRAVELAIQTVEALEAAHAQGIVHRDIKPANIFVTLPDRAKLLDFGLALLISPLSSSHEEPVRRSGSAAGTAPYMSPEQARGEDVDGRSDLFSMGIVLYEMTTGRRAFMGRTVGEIVDAILTQPPIPPRTLNPTLPAELDRIILKALEKNRKLRYQTASDMRADLQRLKRDLDSSGVISSVSGAATRALRPAGTTLARRWQHRRPQLRIAAGASALIVVAVVVTLATKLALQEGGAMMAMPEAPLPPKLSLDRWVPDLLKWPLPPRLADLPKTPPMPPVPSLVPRSEIAAVEKGSDAEAVLAEQDLQIVRTKLRAHLDPQAVESLKDLVAKHPNTSAALEGYFLMAATQERRGQLEDAMATYLEFAQRHQNEERAPEALYRVTELTLRSKRPDKTSEGRVMFANLVERYPQTPWAPRALLNKAHIEEQENAHDLDSILGRTVPSALISYRSIAEVYPGSPEAREAFKKLADMYEKLKLFELAARCYGDLATSQPTVSDEAWFRAAELYRRRLNNPAQARRAYEQVPAKSPYFADAQKQLQKLPAIIP